MKNSMLLLGLIVSCAALQAADQESVKEPVVNKPVVLPKTTPKPLPLEKNDPPKPSPEDRADTERQRRDMLGWLL